MKQLQYILLILFIALPQLVHAGWKDYVKDIKDTVKEKTNTSSIPSKSTSNLSQDVIIDGLKEALNKGVKKSVSQLGQADGFLKDAGVMIPMPKALKKIDKGLRKLGQKKVADKFIATMNRAAEQAVPGTIDILIKALKAMTLKDAVNILKGEPDAATQYFKRSTLTGLRVVIKPVVQKATDKVGLTDAYKKMMKKSGFLAKYVDQDSLDLDQYITNKAIDGLFIKIALEEKNIRKNPIARTSDILKEVFSR
jgi:Protein of unknown function (DUF4197)